MSRKHKFHNLEGLYFVSFATIHWISVFIRDLYFEAITDSLTFCRQNKGMQLYCWCIMPNHIHLIFRSSENNPGGLLRDFKTYTSKHLQKMIEDHPQESRKEWMLWIMQRAGTRNSNVNHRQFWQQHNKPIELWSPKVIVQKVDYIHYNPVESGFVGEPEHWKYSSALDYAGGKGIIDIDYI